ncbi:MAG: hypothetical protein FWD82_06790 [Defluviitaleaceae bacterium]|nr:hypothetical protein [Defluviitaleaceae bacterium]
MNALDLNAYGVSEMNKQEMMETDGGFGLLFIGYLIAKHIPPKEVTVTVSVPGVSVSGTW